MADEGFSPRAGKDWPATMRLRLELSVAGVEPRAGKAWAAMARLRLELPGTGFPPPARWKRWGGQESDVPGIVRRRR